ncbi:hypothetical protein [Synechococcus phage S-B64]|uniref:Fe2OG dioxygenase domain-containing protein n=2 Tax=Shandvirus TaxID=2948904 RepID=A0A1Z1LWA6_9CAUD|nr:2OG-Fe(II) oxygenase [Synechococcus phage S-H35]YP_010095378.1 2OG-Fe(II) oxygenase [Synechococcus phage S-B64]ARW56936.1 hypothetical protein [Synechococcus phage S-H35]AWD90176.1 hypothetical protein [Synechococcus phage S-B64]
MIQLTDLILHIPNFLSPDQCQQLIDNFERREASSKYERCSHATTAKLVQSTFTSVVLTEEDEAYQLFYNSTETLINKYHEHLSKFDAFHVNFKNALRYSHKCRVMKYKPGGWIHPHIDASWTDPWVMGSCSFNLSDDYEGGDFVFFKGKHRIKLGLGDAMIWPADYFWVHEVEEITKGVRYSANSFLQSLPEDYKQYVNSNIQFDHPGAYKIYS